MPRTVEFFFDYGRPYSHLADALLPDLTHRHGAGLVHPPILLGGVFEATGNQPPMAETVAAKRAYGAPTFFLDDEMFFDVDHLPHLERALEETPT